MDRLFEALVTVAGIAWVFAAIVWLRYVALGSSPRLRDAAVVTALAAGVSGAVLLLHSIGYGA